MIPWIWLFVGLVALQRLAELIYARRNTRRLLAAGGREVGAGHYPVIVGLHSAWLVALLIWIPPGRGPDWTLIVLFLLLQGVRLWVIATLGRFWTTRIITVPDQPLVRRGPYRLFRHPNYLVVCLEIAMLPLAFGAWQIAAIFTLLNGAVIAWRIRLENAALARRPAQAAEKSA